MCESTLVKVPLGQGLEGLEGLEGGSYNGKIGLSVAAWAGTVRCYSELGVLPGTPAQ